MWDSPPHPSLDGLLGGAVPVASVGGLPGLRYAHLCYSNLRTQRVCSGVGWTLGGSQPRPPLTSPNFPTLHTISSLSLEGTERVE